MSPRELAARARYKAFTLYEREAHRRGRLADSDRLRLALVPALAQRADCKEALGNDEYLGRFFPGLMDPDRLRDLFERRYPSELRQARALADKAARGQIAFFGREFSLGPEIDWHADPVTGTRWPRAYHRDIPVHGGNVGFGDVKDVWELNRHQFFVDLAKIAFLDRSAPHADVVHRHLGHWMADVPYATGVPWACALEPAFRAWSWMWSFHLLRAAGLVNPAEQRLWLTGFYDHGRFLYRHLERYASPYNHLVGEASALFALGLLFPVFQEAPSWVARGREVLEGTVATQFHIDGASVEQSTFYHHATLGGYLLAAVLGRENGVDLAPGVWDAIERGIQFSAAVIQPDGQTPRIGGADDGKPIRLEHLPLWDFRPYQALGAVLFSRPDFRYVAERFWEDALWILGPEGLMAFERVETRAPETMVALPDSGYYVVRSDWSRNADYLCFDCGPQAAGLRRDGIPSAAHGHADCLSVLVTLGGRQVLVDPGFFTYNSDPEWEVGLRRTAAHNTVVVDGRDQARHVSKMAWTSTYAARPEGWAPQALGWARGSHDGFARGPGRVTHRRTAWLRSAGYVVLCDELTGVGRHSAQAVFQFAAGPFELDGARAVFDGRYECAWICSAPIQARGTFGGRGPLSGWVAPSLGVRHPAPRLDLEAPLFDGNLVLLTIVADMSRLESPARAAIATRREGDQLIARIAGTDFIEEVIAAVTPPATDSRVESDAPLVVVRESAGGVIEVWQAGGTYARVTVATLNTPTARASVP